MAATTTSETAPSRCMAIAYAKSLRVFTKIGLTPVWRLIGPRISVMTLASGTRLDHYEILSAIGKGGMGEVYRARDTRLAREVAIKTLPAHLLEGGEHLARFQREARAASALNHPNICTIFELSEYGGTPFMVMELLKGETLADLLLRGPLALDRALELGVQLADALEAAHAAGII